MARELTRQSLVLTGGDVYILSGLVDWNDVIDLPQITVTGLAAGNAVEVTDVAGNVHGFAVETGGTAILTYTLD